MGIWDRLHELRASVNLRERLPSLTGVLDSRVRELLRIVKAVACLIGMNNITETNNLIYACAAVVTERLGIWPWRKEENKEPWWKRRLQGQINEQRKDLSKLMQIRKQESKKRSIKTRFEKGRD